MVMIVSLEKRSYFGKRCCIATDNMSLSNELQNAISAVSVVQTATLKTAKDSEHCVVRTPNLDMLLSALRTIQPTSTATESVFSVAGNFKTKLRRRIKFRVSNALVIFKIF
jgi:hypothetical protein